MKIYFANALFTVAEQNFNAELAQKIRSIDPKIDLYLPQENQSINDKNLYADSKMIALGDTENLTKSDLVVAILDGVITDPGVAAEIGVAYANKIPIVALYSDSRQLGGANQQKVEALNEIAENQFFYVNLYVIGLIKLNGTVVRNEADLLQEIKQKI
ncbi:nucleoside 2-deoxyribosyltransferase [Xylocopilactobacillus apicola]|uniref:Nucleoside 2-deoxyribosyltransferase n=1 Tax=Xylocopilactobacillus apicola TaxID=2932184 RepID=A0AAU9DDH9_9LACO|nr:nucleoside 2-deoxyribosyltransferase [Xylocopilactobacillus apicola]BDR58877.1 nucleoside 2-deoxyribosyltransferase [Xylocopilactobacillus apicola]